MSTPHHERSAWGRLHAAAGRLKRLALRSALVVLSPAATGPIGSDRVRRILLSGSMGIGNAVMFEPLLLALRERFPGAHLAVAVDANAPSRAVFGWSGMVDEVIPVRGSSRLARSVAGLRLVRRGWDLCVIRFNGATHEMVVAAILGRIPYRVGHVSSGRFSSELDWLFNLPVTMGEYDHEVDRYLALAERLGHRPSRRAPRLVIPDEDRRASERVANDVGLALNRPWIAIQPGTSRHQQWKRWPSEHWQALARSLTAEGSAVVALGSADERELVDEICRPTGAINLAGVCTLGVTAAILERCKILVCTDSALMHVADAIGTPLIGIFGPTDRTRTRPYGTGHTLLVPVGCRGNHEPCLGPNGLLSPDCTWRECMRSIRPEAVLTAVRGRCWSLAPELFPPVPQSSPGETP